jgi:capsular polysaccharide biosynthesis protein
MKRKSRYVLARSWLTGLWPRYRGSRLDEAIIDEARPLLPEGIADSAPAILRPLAGTVAGVTDHAFVKRYRGNLSLDPVSGHVFADRRLVAHSTDLPAERTRERLPRFLLHLPAPRTRYDAVISLHNKFDANYFHFFNNVASKLVMVERAGIDLSIPLILPARIAEQAYVRDATALGLFGDRPVIVQRRHEVIGAKEIYVVKSFDADRSALDFAMDRLGVSPTQDGGRLYLERGPRSPNKRFFRNRQELSEALRRHAVRTVDPQTLTLKQQIALFSGAELIVSPHGAGMTNIIFRRGAPTRVIELFNPSLVSLHYFLLARAYGYDYHALTNLEATGRNSTASSLADIGAIERLL